MKTAAIFCGSFDPFTLGHYNIACRAAKLFDKLYVAIGVNSSKQRFQSIEESLAMVRTIFSDIKTIEVISYEGLTVDLCKKLNVFILLHGLRSTIDLHYEQDIAQLNCSIDNRIENIYLLSDPKQMHISSTAVKELHKYGVDVTGYLPPNFKL